jgi:hypothetical protein
MSNESPRLAILHASTIGIVSLVAILGTACVAVIIHPLWDDGMDEETRLLSHECLSSEMLIVRTGSSERLRASAPSLHHQTGVSDPSSAHNSTKMANGLREHARPVDNADPSPIPMSAVKPDANRNDRMVNNAMVDQMETSRERLSPGIQTTVPTAANAPFGVTRSRASVESD